MNAKKFLLEVIRSHRGKPEDDNYIGWVSQIFWAVNMDATMSKTQRDVVSTAMSIEKDKKELTVSEALKIATFINTCHDND